MTASGHGMNWVIAAVFIVGEMVGGGIVAMPNAMIDAGIWAGIVVTILGAILSGYTGVQLGDNWTILQSRWNEYKEHCRKPYPEIGYRAIGPKAKTFVTICLCATQFGIAVVFLLLAAKNISSFLNSFFSIHINYCYLIVIVAVLVTPFIMLKSPKDFWPIAVGAMTSTSIAVILIIIGAAHDSKECKPAARYPTVKFTDFGLAFGTIMFAYGGHGAFPTIQHDMREPHRFSRAVWIAYAIIFCMYLPVSIIGYVVYGDTLDDSVVNSLQIKWMQQTANVLITLHVFLTIVIVFSPLNQALEEGFKISHDFGIQRVVLRGATMAIITFVAISFPSFGYALDLVGGTTITMMTMLLPGIFNLFLVAGQKKRQDKEAQGLVKPDEEDTEYATLREVIKTTPWPILILNIVVLVFGVVGGVASTASAIKEIVNGNIASPCYVKIFRGGLKFTGSSSSLKCCGKFKNITSIAANVSRCFDN